jgi:putative ABC transport system permease protein
VANADRRWEKVRSTAESAWRDLRVATRNLARSPGLTVAAVVTLALGIGANTAVFSLVDAVLFHPLPVTDPNRLVAFAKQYPQDGLVTTGFFYTEFQTLREHSRPFSGLAAEGVRMVGLGGDEGTRRVAVVFVSADYFRVLGIRPRLGRWFLPDEERDGAAPVVVLSETAWRTLFQADPKVIGKSLRLTGVPVSVVGVAPRGFKGTDLSAAGDVFVPLMAAPLVAPSKENFFSDRLVTTEDGAFSPTSWLRIVGRLRPEATARTAAAELAVIARQTSEARGAEMRFSLTPATEAALPERFRDNIVSLSWLLAGTVVIVLLVGCAGLAGLLLAHMEKRRREFATRLALGASPMQLLRQLLVEVAALACAGAAGGLLVARLILNALSSFDLAGITLERLEPSINHRVLLFAAGAAALTAILCGLLPAWRASFRLDVTSSLKAQRGATGRGRTRLQPAALGLQVALTVVLLVAAGLFIRSIQAGFATDFGFRPDHLVVIEMNPGLRRYSGEQATVLVDRVMERVKQMPGMESVTIGDVPFRRATLSGMRLGVDGERKAVRPYVAISFVDTNYIHTLGMSLARGRGFQRGDGPTSAPVALVNESLARALWAGQDPLGRRVTNLPVAGAGMVESVEVVGVVRDAKAGLSDRGTPGNLYLLRSQNPIFNKVAATVTIRVAGNTDAAASVIAREIAAIDRDLPVVKISSMEELIGRALMTPRLGASLTGWFSVLALALALVGTYGIVAFAVAGRTAEIGLRLALGAAPARIAIVMLRAGVLPVLLGAAVGLAAAWLSARLVGSFLYGIPPQDPLSFVAGPLLLVGTAAVAGYMAARRVSRVDPVVALRSE